MWEDNLLCAKLRRCNRGSCLHGYEMFGFTKILCSNSKYNENITSNLQLKKQILMQMRCKVLTLQRTKGLKSLREGTITGLKYLR